ncbi:hypothetical protein D9V37_14455 [Nocardioides mangrovicus]|uniref:Cell wall-active antibiotics response LiaF-like C-terminal domain-containing protein n=2 Tax=Nocardioides mangrovicus TaxID=2478913 RepID=A0A3L8NZG3_9ACTN|nr:hypothetical protein D9V37_14455 [Nocardioides mangrovicus]
MAVVAVALGCLGVYDAGHHVATGAYWALAVAIMGLGLVIGAFRGRAGGLILAALLATAGLAGSLVVGGVRAAQDLSYDPVQSSDVRSTYRLQTGELSLNLSNLADTAALDGRTVRVRGNAGAIVVVVPRDLRVMVSARVRGPGGIEVEDRYDGGGIGQQADVTLDAATAGAPTLTLDADLRVGHIEVRHDDE